MTTDLRGVVNTSSKYPELSKTSRMSVKFSGDYVKESKSIFPITSVMNIYIVYSLDKISNTRNTDFTAQNCLLGAVKITKNIDTSNYKYVGFGICFDEGSNFSFENRIDAKNIII